MEEATVVASFITVYGTVWCGDCRRAKKTLDGREASYTWVDIDTVPEAAAEVMRLNGGLRSVPTIVFPDGSILVEPSDRQLAARIEEFPEVTRNVTVASTGVSERGRWHGKSIVAGLTGSIIASFCCLPAATAIALGLSLSTAATLSQLIAFQRYFQLAGLVAAGFAAWWIVRRGHGTCSVAEQERRRKWVPLYVFGAFAMGMVVLNLGIIPLLEQLPWLIS